MVMQRFVLVRYYLSGLYYEQYSDKKSVTLNLMYSCSLSILIWDKATSVISSLRSSSSIPSPSIKFIEELCVDLGLEFGNSNSRNQIQVRNGWGANYKPTEKEISFKIKNLKARISNLEQTNNG